MTRQNLGVQGVGGHRQKLSPPLYAVIPFRPRLARGTLYKSLYILLSLCRGLSGSCHCHLWFLSYCPPTPCQLLICSLLPNN